MAKAIRIHAPGGPEALTWEEIEVGAPGKGEVRIRHEAVGLNYIDVYDRSGLYPMAMPACLGREAAGVVVAAGRGARFREGDRVAYVYTPGSYCEERVMPADRLVRVPEGISSAQAAAMMLKGLTAHYLLRRTYRVRKGDPVLIHAAAGGVGLIAVQWAKHLGATVIGVVGSDAKAGLVREHGADHVIVTPREDFTARVREITGGAGVPVVYDSVGKDTFFASLDCLRPLGMMVSYGNASGPPPLFSPMELAKRGSLFLTRPSLFAYIAARKDLDSAARELFGVVLGGVVRIRIGQTYALADAANAHRDLEARRTTGSTVLVP
ncbi:MAG: quinone oxidoreductase [Steroidobacteraceae bacterium]|nr:quinone oxidoreductase [Steroidobacteraceae bacterium]